MGGGGEEGISCSTKIFTKKNFPELNRKTIALLPVSLASSMFTPGEKSLIDEVQLSSCSTNHKTPIFPPYQLYKITFPKDPIDYLHMLFL